MTEIDNAKLVAATRFRKLAELRREGDRVRLRTGDLRDLAEAVDRSVGTVSRVLSGEREPSPELREHIEELAGVPLENIDGPRRTRAA